MPEPFKNSFNLKMIQGMAMHFQKQSPEFDGKEFVTFASKNLEALELKARSQQITEAMIQCLSDDFTQAAEILRASLSPVSNEAVFDRTVDEDGIAGWAAIMPMADYVGLQGQKHFELSMSLFHELTQRSTAEFGIRFFLLNLPEVTLSALKLWTQDASLHVRRLVSEGTRPRLPWAMQLPLFIQDPWPVIDLLEQLKDDESEYVRRSVANNLNDISKDHPDIVAEIAAQWMNEASKERKKLIRHACRSLIKKGHKKTLQVFGYKPPQQLKAEIKILTPEVKLGDFLRFNLSLHSASNQEQSLLIDYVIHHQKANGTRTPKVFKWCTKTLTSQKSFTATKKHAIKKITTRRYYSGLHTVEIMVNGVSVGKDDFQLQMP